MVDLFFSSTSQKELCYDGTDSLDMALLTLSAPRKAGAPQFSTRHALVFDVLNIHSIF
jgi:hypothetical protein